MASASPPPAAPTEQPITRDVINGVWHIDNAQSDDTCATIDAQNNMSVIEKDGSKTDLTLSYSDSKKSITLKMGFFTADTISFVKYMSDRTFDGHYSDGTTMHGTEMTLTKCKQLIVNQ